MNDTWHLLIVHFPPEKREASLEKWRRHGEEGRAGEKRSSEEGSRFWTEKYVIGKGKAFPKVGWRRRHDVAEWEGDTMITLGRGVQSITRTAMLLYEKRTTSTSSFLCFYTLLFFPFSLITLIRSIFLPSTTIFFHKFLSPIVLIINNMTIM